MINDHISDMLARIKNAQRAGHKFAIVTVSKMNKSILDVLRAEGFVDGIEPVQDDAGKPFFKVGLKYFSSGKPAISKAQRFSRSGCRKYRGAEDLPKVNSGLGVAIISTSKGIMTDQEARKQKVGGEVLALFA